MGDDPTLESFSIILIASFCKTIGEFDANISVVSAYVSARKRVPPRIMTCFGGKEGGF